MLEKIKGEFHSLTIQVVAVHFQTIVPEVVAVRFRTSVPEVVPKGEMKVVAEKQGEDGTWVPHVEDFGRLGVKEPFLDAWVARSPSSAGDAFDGDTPELVEVALLAVPNSIVEKNSHNRP